MEDLQPSAPTDDKRIEEPAAPPINLVEAEVELVAPASEQSTTAGSL